MQQSARAPYRLGCWLGMLISCAAGSGMVSTAQSPPAKSPLARLTDQFREYRFALRVEAGTQSTPLHDWNGPARSLFDAVGQRVEAAHCSEPELLALLGDPNRIIAAGGVHGGNVRVGAGERHLLYSWRGGHDYLYFAVRDGRIVAARWWYAGE